MDEKDDLAIKTINDATNKAIDNSAKSAIKSGKWKDPGANLYDSILWYPGDTKRLLDEAYLVVDNKDIKNSPYGKTPYSRSGCKYPHHIWKKDKPGSYMGRLVLSVPGLQAAYSRAKQMGIFKGEVKEHLVRHYKELGLYDNSTMKDDETMQENFEFIESTINHILGTNLYEEDVSVFNEASSIPNDIKALNDKLNKFAYGAVKDGKVIDVNPSNFSKIYKSTTAEEFEVAKGGVCWDYVNYEYNWFSSHGYKNVECQFFVMDNHKENPTHTVLLFQLDGDWYWFESSWKIVTGIHKLNDKYDVFYKWLKPTRAEYGDHDAYCFEYKPSAALEHLSCSQYMNKITSGNPVIHKNGFHLDESYNGDTEIEVLSEWVDRFVHDDSYRESIDANYDGTEALYESSLIGLDVKQKKCADEKGNKNTGALELTFYDDGKMIGTCKVSRLQSEYPYMYKLEVPLNERNKGYGSKIMQYCIDKFNVKELNVLASNKIALELYKKFGFNVYQTRAGEEGPYYVMRRGEGNLLEEVIPDDYFDEASQGKLKFDFRFAEDIDTGHKLKIIYSLEDMNLDGNYQLKGNDKYALPDGKEGIRDLKRNGSTDHISSNQKVLAIIDTVTGEHLQQAKTAGPFKGISTYDNKNPHVVKVGEDDKMMSYKSTFMGHGSNDNDILVAREMTPHMRGVKGHQMDPGDREYNPLRVEEYKNKDVRTREEANRKGD